MNRPSDAELAGLIERAAAMLEHNAPGVHPSPCGSCRKMAAELRAAVASLRAEKDAKEGAATMMSMLIKNHAFCCLMEPSHCPNASLRQKGPSGCGHRILTADVIICGETFLCAACAREAGEDSRE